jgi:Holliday junction resolvase RusA-like endonuclease
VEDALQFSGLIHDDSQIVEYKECRLEKDMRAPFIKMEVREL